MVQTMIKVVFDHIEGFGKITEQDFIYSDPKGIAQGTDFVDYLEEGWVEWGQYWYNLRSTRIKIEDYAPTKTVRKLAKEVNVETVNVDKETLSILTPIYEAYVESKGFTRDINLKDFRGYKALLYSYQGKVIGASIFRVYRQDKKLAMVVYQFLWDYQSPKLSLGNVAQFYEISLIKGYAEHIYLLGGYEESCIYKSQFKGFEWWTGSAWSNDINLYTQLCKKDTHAHIRTH
jgi:arginyl-tRNA--protein-N-Asp/Glu arginylyltransferase